MVDVRPFRALRPAPGSESRVVSPPYDVVDVEAARAYAGGDPDSFLRVSRPEIDLPADVDPHAPEVYERGRANLAEHVVQLCGPLVAGAIPIGDHVDRGAGDGRRSCGKREPEAVELRASPAIAAG